MAEHAEHWNFRRFTCEGNVGEDQYFVMSRVHENADDYEASSFDLTVSYGQSCWSGKGLTRPRTQHADTFRKMLSALGSTVPSDKTEYKVRFTRKADKLQVACQWKNEDASVFAAHKPFELSEDTNTGRSGSLIFDTLLRKCEALQASSKKCSEQISEWKTVAQKSQHLLKELVEKQGSREADLYVKFAAVLNEKKKKLRELKAEVDALREQKTGGKKESAAPAATAQEREPSTEPSAGENGSDQNTSGAEDELYGGSGMDADTEPLDDADGEEQSGKVESSKARS